METLKDIKEVLNKVPDEVLERCFFGIGENTEETVGLICMATDGDKVGYPEVWDKYPDLSKIDGIVQNVKKAQEIMDTQERAEEHQFRENSSTFCLTCLTDEKSLAASSTTQPIAVKQLQHLYVR